MTKETSKSIGIRFEYETGMRFVLSSWFVKSLKEIIFLGSVWYETEESARIVFDLLKPARGYEHELRAIKINADSRLFLEEMVNGHKHSGEERIE
mgnify:CR=1 FL=1